jgi:hypothetical protein
MIEGRTLEAIKLYRKATGEDLRDAKNNVEVLMRRMLPPDVDVALVAQRLAG